MEQYYIEANECLSTRTLAFFNAPYVGGNWKIDGTIEKLIVNLKNTNDDKRIGMLDRLMRAADRLIDILKNDLPKILLKTEKNNLTACVIPRARRLNSYSEYQLFFRRTVATVARELNGFCDGVDYIDRRIDTITTHLFDKKTHLYKNGSGADGELPCPGITKKTCDISPEVSDKDILLIDDLYTLTINIDEDAIQALLDNGAKSVTFYSIGKTVGKTV